MLAPIQAALEDLPVPNKFADAFSCSHKCHEEVCRSRCSSKVALQGRSTNGYEDFHVDNDTDEREEHLDEFVGPQLEPQLSSLTMRVSSRKLSKAQDWNHDNQHAASSVHTVALNVLFERLQKAHFAFKLQFGGGCSW